MFLSLSGKKKIVFFKTLLSHLFEKCIILQAIQIGSSPRLVILPSKEEPHPLAHSVYTCKQSLGKAADESCPLGPPHNSNMTLVSRHGSIWNKDKKFAKFIYMLPFKAHTWDDQLLWWRKDSVPEQWEEGGSRALSGSCACLTWWRISTLPRILHCLALRGKSTLRGRS